MTDVLCVGHGCWDIIMPVAEFPVENTKYVVPEFRESPGGPACNAASLLGRWGASVAFAGLLGDDAGGEKILRCLASWGVDVSLTELRPEHPTPVSFIIANETTGSRTVFNRKRSGVSLGGGPADLHRTLGMPGPRVLLFDGHELEMSLAAIRAWPEAVTVLDAGSLRPGTEVLSGIVDFCVASERFVREIAGLSPSQKLTAPGDHESVLRTILLRGAKHAAVTLGEKGCCFIQEDRFFHLPAYPARAVDTTAAGDIFHGAFTYGILSGRNFADALRLAAAAAGLSVERPGGRDSIPRLEETLRALSDWASAPAAGVGF